MTTSFPGAADSLTNPTAGSALTSPSHSAQHTNANDAIEAIEAWALGGTSFPASPVNNQRFYRTDRDVVYYWDAAASRWLSVHVETTTLQALSGAVANVTCYGPKPAAAIWAVELVCSTFANATNNGTNFWQFSLQYFDAAAAPTNVGAGFNTSADTAASWTPHSQTLGVELSAAADGLQLVAAKVLSPGSLFLVAMVRYRLVG